MHRLHEPPSRITHTLFRAYIYLSDKALWDKLQKRENRSKVLASIGKNRKNICKTVQRIMINSGFIGDLGGDITDIIATDRVRIVLEDTFGIEISDEVLENLTTVGSLISTITQQVQEHFSQGQIAISDPLTPPISPRIDHAPDLLSKGREGKCNPSIDDYSPCNPVSEILLDDTITNPRIKTLLRSVVIMGWEEGNKKRSLFEAEVRLGRAHEYYTSVISNPEKPSGPLKRSAQMHLKTAAEWFRYDVARALEQTK